MLAFLQLNSGVTGLSAMVGMSLEWARYFYSIVCVCGASTPPCHWSLGWEEDVWWLEMGAERRETGDRASFLGRLVTCNDLFRR
jgi:hypothetical protein